MSSTPPPETATPSWRARLAAAARALSARIQRAPWRRIGQRIGKGAGIAAGAVFALFAATALFDWNLLRGPVSGLVSASIGRPVRIEGPLDVDLFTFNPRAEASGIIIGNPDWARAKGMTGNNVTIERFEIATRLLPLLIGDATLTRLELEKPVLNFYREADGRATWSFGGSQKSDKPFSLPAIRHFLLKDGRLNLRDERRELVLEAALSSTESADGGARPFSLNGTGQINGEPFVLRGSGGALLNVRRDRPYAFQADIRAGPTRARLSGRMERPFDFGKLSAGVRVTGADLAHLYLLTGVTLPNTPPYNLTAQMRRDGKRTDFTKIDGSIGDTDLRGELSVNKPADRIMLTASLRSKSLDFDDLSTVLGAPPSTRRGETSSAAQKAEAKVMAANARLLPDATLDLQRVRNMDARVTYQADSVETQMWPLRRASATITLDHGVLTLSPLAFSLPRGDLAGRISIDAREDIPRVDFDMRLTNARIEDFMAKFGNQNALEGVLQARAKLVGRGNSVRKAAASADGQVTIVSPRGEVREALAELLGVNVVKGLGLLLAKDQGQIPVRCAVANFTARNGILTAEQIVFDTGPVIAYGSGTVSLRDEALDLSLQGQSKEPRLIRVTAPITVKGPLRSPKVGVDAGKAAGQAGLATVLGALLTPLAAILPFVDPGLAEDADCGALLKQAKQKGAPGNLTPAPATGG